MLRTSYTLVLALGVVACTEAPTPQPTQAAPTKLPALTVDPALARLPLGERLQHEASERPVQAIHPEQLESALATQGVVITRSRQVLASPLGASYCEMSVTETGLGLSVCEFVDAASATTGQERSRQLFDALVPGRTLRTQGSTLLTVTRPESEPAARQAELILSVFAAQRPTALPTATALVDEKTDTLAKESRP
jgi:hypothetical protein